MLLAISGENLMAWIVLLHLLGWRLLVSWKWLLIYLPIQTWTGARGGFRIHPLWSLDTWRVALVVDCHGLWMWKLLLWVTAGERRFKPALNQLTSDQRGIIKLKVYTDAVARPGLQSAYYLLYMNKYEVAEERQTECKLKDPVPFIYSHTPKLFIQE